MATHQPKDGHPPEGSILQTQSIIATLGSILDSQQVSACKMEPRSGIIIGQNLYVAAAPTRPPNRLVWKVLPKIILGPKFIVPKLFPYPKLISTQLKATKSNWSWV